MTNPEERHDRDGILSDEDGNNDEPKPKTLSELLDERRNDAEAAKIREDREAYMEKMEAFLKRPIVASELERPELGKLFGRKS